MVFLLVLAMSQSIPSVSLLASSVGPLTASALLGIVLGDSIWLAALRRSCIDILFVVCS
jgi:hypothetical protein